MRPLISSTLCWLFFQFSSSASAQSALQPQAGALLHLDAYSPRFAGALAAGSQQGALARLTVPSVGVYGERRFLLDALAFYQLAAALPTPSGSFGLQGVFLGHAAHHSEAKLGLAYARPLGENLSLGVQFNYHSLSVAGYGAASTVSVEAGLLVQLSPQLHLGLQATNPTAARLGKEAAVRLPARYALGLGYEVSGRFLLATELLHDGPSGLDGQAALHYRLADKLSARCGFAFQAASYALGLGVGWQRLRLEALASIHPQLGLTPGLCLTYLPKPTKDD